MLTFAGKPSTMSSLLPVDFQKNSTVGQQRQRQMPQSNHFGFEKIQNKNQVATCSDFSSEAMFWIKEVEMVDSIEELESS